MNLNPARWWRKKRIRKSGEQVIILADRIDIPPNVRLSGDGGVLRVEVVDEPAQRRD